MEITVAMIKELRELTDAGMMDCKRALEAHAGDMAQAAAELREKGLARAAERSDRETTSGLVIVQEADGAACALQLSCETDFVALTDGFKRLAHRLADQLLQDPRLDSVEELLAADFVDTPGKPVATVVQELIGKVGENIAIQGLARYSTGGGNLVHSYVHSGALEGYYGPQEGRIGVLVEVCGGEAPGSGALQALAHELALQIAATGPRYIALDDIPAEVMEKQRAELLAQLVGEKKPESIKDKIVQGRMAKFVREVCLLEQPCIRDDSMTVGAYLRQQVAELGVAVEVRRFARMEVGKSKEG